MENSTVPINKESENKTSKSRITKFLGIPIIALIGYVFGVFGTIFGVWTYFDSKVSPDLTMKLNPVRTIVVKSGQASKLQTVIDNKIIQTDVTAAQLSIWNRGKKVIQISEVLEAITIQTENNTPILEATVLNQTRSVNQIQINTAEIDQGKITVSWKILERNDGALIQLIYAGDTSVPVKISGIIIDQPQVTVLTEDVSNKANRNSQNSETSNYLFLFLSILCGFLSLIIKPIIASEFGVDIAFLEAETKKKGIYENEKSKLEVLRSMQKAMLIFSKFMRVAFAIPSVILLGYFFYRMFIQSSSITPFGF